MKYQIYTKYKPSGVEWIGDVPDDWNNRRLKSIIFKIENGQWGEDELGNNSDWFVLRVADFNEMKFNLKKELTVRNVSNKRLRLYNGDLVMEKSGGGEKQLVGRVVQFVNNKDDDNKYTYSNFVGKLSVSNELNNRFLLYFFKTFYNNKVNYKYIKQTTGIQNLNCDSLLQNEFIALPVKNDQNKIADFLDLKTKQIDGLIKKDKRLIELLKEKRIAMINKAVTKGLDDKVRLVDSGVDWIGEIPEGWEVRRLKHCFGLIGSGTTPDSQNEKYYSDGNIPWLITGDLNDGILYDTSKKVTREAVRVFSVLKIFPINSLVIAMYGATIGKIALITFQTTTNQACCVLNNSKLFSMKFVYFWFLANKNEIISLSYGGGQPNISQDVIKTLKIQVPPIDTQNKIVKFLDFEVNKIEKYSKKIMQRIELFKEYKKSLIYNAVTGKIKV